MFTPDVIEGGLPLDVDEAKLIKSEMEDEIIDYIKELVEKNEVKMAREFKLDITDSPKNSANKAAWKKQKEALFDALDGENGVKLVQIYGYENIIKVAP